MSVPTRHLESKARPWRKPTCRTSHQGRRWFNAPRPLELIPLCTSPSCLAREPFGKGVGLALLSSTQPVCTKYEPVGVRGELIMRTRDNDETGEVDRTVPIDKNLIYRKAICTVSVPLMRTICDQQVSRGHHVEVWYMPGCYWSL